MEAFCPTCGKCLDVAYDYELARDAPAGAADGASVRRTSGDCPSCCRSATRSAQARVGQISGYDAADPGEQTRGGAGAEKTVCEGRQHLAPEPLLQGQGRVDRGRARCSSWARARSAACPPATSAPRSHRSRPRPGVTPYVFYPNRLEQTKARACRALGARVCQVSGNYDEANRECRKVAAASGLEFANITLRPFYAEGAKTMAFEIVEQLGWRAPDHIVSATAGGTLSSRLHKGLVELETVGLARRAPRRCTSPSRMGCSPIATRSSPASRDPAVQARRRSRTRWRSALPATDIW